MDHPKLRKLIETELQNYKLECKFKNCADAKYDGKYHTVMEYNDNKYPKRADVENKKPFTDAFLKIIDQDLKRDKPINITIYLDDIVRNYFNKGDGNNSQLLKTCIEGDFPISEPTPTGSMTTTLLIPSKNSLYFLYLANLYCNHAEYAAKYPWLKSPFLSLCEQNNLTGVFGIDNRLYMELFGQCSEENKPSGYEILDGYFRLSNTAIRLEDGPVKDHYDNPGQTMEDFLATPSPLIGSVVNYSISSVDKLKDRIALQSASKTQFTAPKIPNKNAASKSVAHASKPAAHTSKCRYGTDCKSHKRAQSGSTYPKDLSHTSTYTHGGTNKKRKTNKKRRTYKKKKTTYKRKKTYKRK